MPARNCGYGAGATLAHLVPGKQVRLRLAVRPGALYRRRAFNRWSMIERKLDKVLELQVGLRQDIAGMRQDIGGMRQDIGGMRQDIGGMRQDIGQLKMDMAWINKALVLVNLTPLASLVLGVLYFVYSNFMASGGGSN